MYFSNISFSMTHDDSPCHCVTKKTSSFLNVSLLVINELLSETHDSALLSCRCWNMRPAVGRDGSSSSLLHTQVQIPGKGFYFMPLVLCSEPIPVYVLIKSVTGLYILLSCLTIIMAKMTKVGATSGEVKSINLCSHGNRSKLGLSILLKMQLSVLKSVSPMHRTNLKV